MIDIKMMPSLITRKNEAWLSPVRVPYVGDTIKKAREVIKTEFSPYATEEGLKPVKYVDCTKLMLQEKL